MNENEQSVMTRLTKPFRTEEVKWRATMSGLNQEGKPWCRVAPYLDARTLQDRLDDVLGAENWSASYRQSPGQGILCTLRVRINGEWIEKCDAASMTEVEPVKGGISSAYRRACCALGLGRYLYKVGDVYGVVTERGQYKGSAKDKTNNTWVNFRWNPPKLDADTAPEQKPVAKRELPPKPIQKPPAVPPAPAETVRREPTFDDLPMSLKQIFQEVKISPAKAMEMVKRKGHDYAEVERIIRDLLPELNKTAAA